MPTLAENLRRIRTEHDLSQARLAKAAGVSQQLISQIERGENTSTKELPEIATALQVSVADLDESFRPVATSTEEEDILARYRKASPRQKALALELLREMVPSSEEPG